MLTVVFDADCGVCQASVTWLRKRDPLGTRFQFVGNDAAELPAGVSQAETEHTVVVLGGARKWTRGGAVSRVLRALPWWSPLGWVIHAPGLAQVADAGYDAFARRRHRISAALGLDACAMPERKR